MSDSTASKFVVYRNFGMPLQYPIFLTEWRHTKRSCVKYKTTCEGSSCENWQSRAGFGDKNVRLYTDDFNGPESSAEEFESLLNNYLISLQNDKKIGEGFIISTMIFDS